jgi:hypothetical protein
VWLQVHHFGDFTDASRPHLGAYWVANNKVGVKGFSLEPLLGEVLTVGVSGGEKHRFMERGAESLLGGQ